MGSVVVLNGHKLWDLQWLGPVVVNAVLATFMSAGFSWKHDQFLQPLSVSLIIDFGAVVLLLLLLFNHCYVKS